MVTHRTIKRQREHSPTYSNIILFTVGSLCVYMCVCVYVSVCVSVCMLVCACVYGGGGGGLNNDK